MTLGLGIITRNKDIELLETALTSVLWSVDNIYVTVADTEEPSEAMKTMAQKFNFHLSYFPWVNDFAAARNFNMSQCKDDWFTWMDTDDTVVGMDKAKAKLEALNANIAFVLCTYNYAFYASGQVATKHPKERFFRNDGSFTWKGKLHENCVADHAHDGAFFDDILWNHNTNDERSLESAQRNVGIIEDEIREQVEAKKLDPRTVFNLGMAYASIAQRTMDKMDWVKAIRAFQQYINVGGWSEHAYMAWKFIGYGQLCVDRPDLALVSYFEALKVQPAYSDSYAAIGSAYDRMNELEKAEIWYKLALTDGRENAYAHDVGLSVLTPLVSLARIYALRGKANEAEKYAKMALKISGKDENTEGLLKEIQSVKKRIQYASKIVKRLKSLPDDKAKREWEALPESDKSIPEVTMFRRSKRWKEKSSGKDLVIFCGQSWEEWTPDNEKSGIGGSEEAAINMAREFKNLGWNVTVYGSHGPEPKEYGGVWYRPWWDFGVEEPIDVFIGWRDPNVFEFKVNAKKSYLWLHDVIPSQAITEKRLNNISKVIVLSEFQRRLFPHVPDEKIMVSRNGIIPSHFDIEVERVKDKIVYTSAPNRGLLCLLEMWPKIRERLPNAELHWAYGWQSFDKGAANNPQMQAYKKLVIEKLNQAGVTDHGRIGHEELARLMKSASIWAYPTEFEEISCITGMKMQAAGAIPVCTTVAALDETVQYGHKLPYLDIYTNEKAQEEFINAIVEASAGYPKKDEMEQWARSFYGWEAVAKEWDKEFGL